MNNTRFRESFFKLIESMPDSLTDFNNFSWFLTKFLKLPSNSAAKVFARLINAPIFFIKIMELLTDCDLKRVAKRIQDPVVYLGPGTEQAFKFWDLLDKLHVGNKNKVLSKIWESSPRMHVDDEFRAYIYSAGFNSTMRNYFIDGVNYAASQVAAEIGKSYVLIYDNTNTYYILLWATLVLLRNSIPTYTTDLLNTMEELKKSQDD